MVKLAEIQVSRTFAPNSFTVMNRHPLLKHSLRFGASQVVLLVKEPTKVGEIRGMKFNPRSGRAPGGGHGNPLQYSRLESPQTEEPGGLQSQGHSGSDTGRSHTHTHPGAQAYAREPETTPAGARGPLLKL